MAIDRSFRQDSVITVVGTGEVRARADIMHLVLEVRTRGASAMDALDENNRRDAATRQRLRGLGVHEESIETSGISFLPASGDGITLSGSSEAQGFVAVRHLSINVFFSEDEAQRLPSQVARILDEAGEGGAQAGARHQINLAIFRSPSVTFGLENDEAPRTEAMRRAMLSARVAAEETAQAIGAEVDEILNTQILELGSLVHARLSASAFSMAGIDMPRPAEVGRVTVKASVAVTFRTRQAPPRADRNSNHMGHFTLERVDNTPSGHPDRTREFS